MNQDEIGKIETREPDFTTVSRKKNRLNFHVSLILIALLCMLSKLANIISIFPIPISLFPLYNKEQMRVWKRPGEWPRKNTRFLIPLQAISHR